MSGKSLRVQESGRRKVVTSSTEGVTCLKTKEQFQMSDSYEQRIGFC